MYAHREKKLKEKARQEARKARKDKQQQEIVSAQTKEHEEKRIDFARLLKPKIKEKLLMYLRSLAPPLPNDVDTCTEAKAYELTDDELLGGLREDVLNISSIEELQETYNSVSKKSKREYMIERQQRMLNIPEVNEEDVTKQYIKEAEEELEEESSNIEDEEDDVQNRVSADGSTQSKTSSAEKASNEDSSSSTLHKWKSNTLSENIFEEDDDSSELHDPKRKAKLSRSQRKSVQSNKDAFYDNLEIEKNL
eukprot:753861-Hanusia_phi.AAC.1